jgi:hypothetical protein
MFDNAMVHDNSLYKGNALNTTLPPLITDYRYEFVSEGAELGQGKLSTG